MEEIIKQCLPAYTVDKKIGKGVYGSVYRVYDAFKKRAVKVVPITIERSLACSTEEKLDSRVSQDFHAVRKYYEKIKGTGVVEIHDFFLVDKKVTLGNARAYLVILMQLCRANLLDYVIDNHPLPITTVGQFMRSLAAVLRRLSIETDGIFLLTDLKPSNLLINGEKEVLIGDLGGLKRLSSASTSAGAQFSPNWSSPEFILQGARPDVSAAVFSFGLVSYFMLEGHLPYEDEDFSGRIRHIKSDGITFSRNDLPDTIRYIIEWCVQFDPRLRPDDFSEILEVLKTGEMPVQHKPTTVPIGNRGELSIPQTDTGSCSSQSFKPELFQPGQQWCEPIAGIEFAWVPGHVATGSGSQGKSMAGFWMGRYPVTQGQWQQVMGQNPSHFTLGSNYPVEGISWGDALDFARRLAALNKSRYLFCLPTESQWEHAARWETGHGAGVAGHVDRLAWHNGNSGLSTQPVGQKVPTGLGLHDLLGNVMEWCGEGSAVEIYQTHRRHGSAYDEVGLKQAGRGGSWKSTPEECCPDSRKLFPRQLGYANLGFRVVRLKRQPDE
ncbi:MAG: SUMF1/EgtB/PvdO family nonheme iron enzyme [Desulfobacterales bacterium]|nr:SUMF1/EgtB/PvdO family nonheme iron enzyme [Desulfobacterales bacterium]